VYRHDEEMIVTPQDRTGNPGPEQKTDGQAPQRFSWRNVVVFLGLLLVNYLVVSLLFTTAANPRVEIPYRPTFMAQLRDGNVATKTTEKIVEETVLGRWTYFFRVVEVQRESSSGSTTWHTSKTTRERIDPVTREEIKGTNLENIILLALLIYWAAMESSRYQASLGKMIFGMKVVGGDGKRLSLPIAFGRNLLKLLSAIILFIGFMMAGWTRRKQALHDKIMNCFVVLPRD